MTVTATGSLMGTPEYMSPEQLRGDDVDFRSDLYSLGVVAFELFTGTLPFLGDTPVATIVKQLHDPPCLDVPALPGPIRPVLVRALAKDPSRPLRQRRRPLPALETAYGASATAKVVPHAGPSRPQPEDDTRPVNPGAGPESPPDRPDGARAGGARGLRRLSGERRRRRGAPTAAERADPGRSGGVHERSRP